MLSIISIFFPATFPPNYSLKYKFCKMDIFTRTGLDTRFCIRDRQWPQMSSDNIRLPPINHSGNAITHCLEVVRPAAREAADPTRKLFLGGVILSIWVVLELGGGA